MGHLLRLAPLLAAAVAALPPGEARACGCFAPPDVSSPVIQAGERIAFTANNGQITAFIQIQWSGKASEFGWLLPLPSLPTLEVGTDQMFTVLQQATDPVFTLNTFFNCSQSSGGGCGSAASPASGGDFFPGAPDLGVAVRVDSVGPYDYAVLKADSKQAMLDWLNQNRYYVPAGTDAAVTPYIHPGGYFLALKLRSGKSSGDIQPVVVHYASDLPMIPIVLTSVGAVPHMGVLVWVLGSQRAIPRNYSHSVLNLAALDWRGAANYNDLLVRAVAEAPKHHTFVTEYAGTSRVLGSGLTVPTATEKAMAANTDAPVFVRYLRNEGFDYPFTGPLKAILVAHIPEPKELSDIGVTADQFYAQIDSYLTQWRAQFPNATIAFDAAATAREIQTRVIDPLVVANDAFRKSSYLTRLHTALSPEEMTEDPVFSFNGSLPEVSNQHFASLELGCGGGDAVLNTGGEAPLVSWPGSNRPASADSWPASLRIETLSEVGGPTVITDNTSRIPAVEAPGSSDGLKTVCSVGPAPAQQGMWLILGLLGAVALWQRKRVRH